MILYFFLGIFIVYLIISFLILPFQYRFLVALKEEEKKNKFKGKTQGEMYDEMGEQGDVTFTPYGTKETSPCIV